jgi:hypothetical protein
VGKFQVGQRIQIIDIDYCDFLWFRLGATGVITEVRDPEDDEDGTLCVDFSRCDFRLYTPNDNGNQWTVCKYQVEILD